MLVHSPVELRGFAARPPDYQRFTWQITGQCDLRCLRCGDSANIASWQACQCCIRFSSSRSNRWDLAEPESIVDEAADLGVRTIHIRGGNPLLAWPILRRIVDRASRFSQLKVLITTAGTGQCLGRVLSLYDLGPVHFNVVMLGLTREDYLAMCQCPEVLPSQVELIDTLAEKELPFSVTLMLTEPTRGKREEAIRLTTERWGGRPGFSEVYWRDSSTNQVRFSHSRTGGKQLHPWRSLEEFYFRCRANTCLYGNFDLGVDGYIRPCAALGNVCGDVVVAGLHAALTGDELYTFWDLHKGMVEPCGHCPLRLACADCTAAELLVSSNAVGRTLYCPYDPDMEGDGPHICQIPWEPSNFVQLLKLEEEPEDV